MSFLGFFKKKETIKPVTVKRENASPEQTFFAETVLEIIGPIIENHNFTRLLIEIKSFSTNIIFKKKKQYIKINSTNYPTDYPYYFNIILGEGQSEDFFEYDWNSVALWGMARILDPTANIVSYDFPIGNNVKPIVQKASSDLLKYGDSFLNGNLNIFRKARKAVNEKREPYKIHKPDNQGGIITTDEPNSVAKKRKYS